MPDWVIGVGALLTMLAFVQAVIWLNNNCIGPFMQRRLPGCKEFRTLIKSGFWVVPQFNSRHEFDGSSSAVALIGKVEDYAVEISSNYFSSWWTFPFYTIRVFFNTDGLTRDELLTRRENNLSQSAFFRWNEDIVLTCNHVDRKEIGSGFGPPSSHSVLDTAKELVAELRMLGLKPVEYVEGVDRWRINHD